MLGSHPKTSGSKKITNGENFPKRWFQPNISVEHNKYDTVA